MLGRNFKLGGHHVRGGVWPHSMERQESAKELFEKEALKYIDELFGSAMRMTRQKEAVPKICSAKCTPKPGNPLLSSSPGPIWRAWLYKILTNTYINHYRQKQRLAAAHGGT